MPFSKTAGSKPGVEIWRIEKMDVAPVDPASYGQFFSGDCYIVLKTTQKNSAFNWDLHYWLGSKCSQDEQGAVAYKAVELDDQLGGAPIQHREVQGYESGMFMSYFPKGIQYMEGGVASAFRHVDPNAYTARLFQVKGKRSVRVQEVEKTAASLNQGDVFILDLGMTLYQWNGKTANKYEKFKALEVINKIKDQERGGKAKCVFLEHDSADAEFWKNLGDPKLVKSDQQGGDDDDQKSQPAKLFRVSDSTGSVVCKQEGEGRLEKRMLDSNDCFLVDTGTSVFVWIGSKATKQERSKGMQFGQEYLKQNNRPDWTPLARVAENGEPPAFKALFAVWEEPKKVSASAAAKPAEKPKADVSAIYSARGKGEEEKMVDDGSGKLEIWRIENMKKAPYPKHMYGQFFQGDSYILLYSYKKSNGKEAHIIYFWQGRDSSSDERGASALLTVDLDQQIKSQGGADPVQVRVVQSKEPNHFLTLFKGKMIVHSGGEPSAFANKKQVANPNPSGVALYQIKGTTALNTRAIQVKEVAASLNSSDTFILLTKGECYVWCGKGSTKDEKQVAMNIANVLHESRKIVQVDEGNENAEFWSSLGGKGEYQSSKELEEGARDPRLFHGSTVHGAFKIEEIFNFSQDDLINDDVMILDVYSEVYVWIGHDSTKEEKDSGLQTALDYVKNAPDGRSKDTPVYRVLAGSEPPSFTCHFFGWDDKKANDFEDPYLKGLNKLGQAKGVASPKLGGGGAASPSAPAAALQRVGASDIGYLDPATNKFTLAQIVAGVINMDTSKKEAYLSDDEFVKIFKMDREKFAALPKWKQTDEKKKNKLF